MRPRSLSLIGWLLLAAIAATGGAMLVVQGARLPDHAGRMRPPQATGQPAPQVNVFAGVPPLGYLVERVGGPHVHVDVLVQPGQDPHVFEPMPRQVMALGKAALYFKVGMPFEERLLERMAEHRGLTVIDTARGIRKRMIAEACCEDGHRDEHEHAHEEPMGRQVGDALCRGEPDPHVWLSPPLAKTLAANVAEALCRADPPHAVDYHKNLAELDAELDALHARIARALAPYRGHSFYVFHPAFGYFGDAYGLKQESVEIEGKSPLPRQLRHLVQRARADGVKIIFLQPQFDQRSAEAVAAAIGGAVLPLDDLAKDLVKNLDDVARKVAAALGDAGASRCRNPRGNASAAALRPCATS
jgi:zinc transport system substrate-binding protein